MSTSYLSLTDPELARTSEVKNTQPPELRFGATLGPEPKVDLALV